MCPGGQAGQWYPGVHWEEHWQQVEGADLCLYSGEAISGVLCAVLDSSGQEGHGAPRAGPAEDNKDE